MKSARWWGMILGAMVVSQAYADHIFVSGDVTGTWAVDTVFVTGEIRVPPGETLAIEPGVKVLFEGWYKLIVDSTAALAAFGNISDSIYFMPTYWEGWPFYSGWFGIRFLNASNSSILNYCSLTYASAYLESGGSMENQSGGGIHCNASSPTIANCLIDHCFADYYGGGIFCTNGSEPIISNNTLTANEANVGGAIYCNNSSPQILYNTIAGNSAINGAGIACENYSDPIINYNAILDNSAVDVYSCGGGIFLEQSSPNIGNNEISGNTCHWNGGGIWCSGDSGPMLINNVINQNICHNGGGGIGILGSSITFINNVISENTCEGGVAGGLHVWTSQVMGCNCIIWNNEPDEILAGYNSTFDISYSDIRDTVWWPGIGNMSEDPLFVAGPLSDYQLSPTSPCIDAGNPELQYNDPEDPANPGFALWPALGTIRNDMGAYGGSGASGWVGILSNPPVA